ncbi:hypothetical protein ACP_0731 [Acidobacterium capsulatum ATCC 51196]|uniref:Uncharacterized protein n=1 Tax=Acidobacterium capsulatum (strain ATCC 51196 / DSM 11244 / BCRC 80197 / JCM 7670 / NBRC 15755 / NCIMB 13165 / 161) TaxID=240015 RepID=C1F272_ACIC5|nr:hypothetical protein ACP_0731 [Acidobacterium capsulatum ATCC 51196]
MPESGEIPAPKGADCVRLPARPHRMRRGHGAGEWLFRVAQKCAELFILIACNVVHAGLLRGAPANFRGGQRAEVVAVEPPATALLRNSLAVEGVEANPKMIVVRMVHQRAQAGVIGGGPCSGASLATLFHYVPGVIPPAAIVAGRFRIDHAGRGRRVGIMAVYRAEEQQLAAYGNLVIKDLLLRVLLACQYENRPHGERRHLGGIGGLARGGKPVLVLLEQLPHGLDVLRVVVFEIEV